MEHFTYCIICLGTDVKMFNLNSIILRTYKELIPINDELCIKHMHACYECAFLLLKYAEFKSKCCKAYDILCSLSAGSFEVNKEKLRSVDRQQNKLKSRLTTCNTSNYYHHDQQNEYWDSEKAFHVGMVKSESVLIQEQFNENTSHSQQEIHSDTSDPITLGDHLYNQFNLIKEVTDVKRTSEDDNFSSHMLKTNRNNKSIKEECMYEINRKVEVSKKKKRNHEMIKKKIVHNKVHNSKRRKSRKKVLTENVMSVCDVDDNGIKKLKSQKIGSLNDNVGGRFTIESNIFKEHMTIVQLTPEDAKNELLLRKESRNYLTNTHKCDLCYRGFISKSTYQTHMKKHSLEYGTLKCEICQLSFTETRYLTNHRIVCHTRKFICKICPYVCFGANQARAHIRSHKGKKYTCKECGEIFRFPNSLSTHIRLRHSMELVCDLCGSTFASPKGLDCHKRLLHRKEKNEHLGPKCEECDVHFASERAWKRHLVLCSRHEVSEGCGCRVCGDTFPDTSALRAHLRAHGPLPSTWNCRLRVKPPVAAPDSAAPRACPYCEKELSNKKEYKIHMSSEHPQVDIQDIHQASVTPQIKWICEVCGKMFKHRSLFISHQRKHTGEKPYSCPECGKRFKRADAVKAHRPLHTKEYVFKCHLCHKAYGDRGKLNRHIKGHLGIRPYKCSYCEKSFLYQCIANAHTKYVHCKEPYPKRDRSKRTSVKARIK